jgi:hypothetical protein
VRRTGTRRWGVVVFRNLIGAPMFSLGIHVDLHTPTLDLHVADYMVQIGRNLYEPDGPGSRLQRHRQHDRWHGHTGNCDHDR